MLFAFPTILITAMQVSHNVNMEFTQLTCNGTTFKYPVCTYATSRPR